ncbi:Uma2 family endonuclease [Chroococcidiopsis sp.]|uniref:Uma2 family endonuclease n=1 Tax=Chroococcidiopsis sp. TaxID=3088168 RepID=UPI003F34123E
MTSLEPPILNIPLPDHTQLPESDGSIVQNFQEHPQSILLTESIWSTLQQIHPDGQFAVGQDCGIYWRITDPPLNGCKAPDWFYVPNVPPMLSGQIRRSYVMWQEIIAPIIVLEFASGDGSEERDDTPMSGKLWVYEQGIRVPFYGIYEVERSRIQVYQLIAGRYQLMSVNERERYPIPPLGVELGIWQGRYKNLELPWLRWWDNRGDLLLTGEERAEQAETRASRLAARLRAMGIDPDAADI